MIIETPTFMCEASLMPSFKVVNDPFKSMTSLSGKIKSAAIEFAQGTPATLPV